MTDDEMFRVNEPEPAYDAVIPAPVRYDDELPARAKLLYAEIRALCKRRGFCWATNAALARHYRVQPLAVSLWLKTLATRGHIVIEIDQKMRSHRRIYLAEAYRKNIRQPYEKTKGYKEEKANVALAAHAEQIYSAYPRKAERPRALGSIRRALKKVEFEFLLERTQAFARAVAGAESRYIKHPATWYNNECWNDGEREWASVKRADKEKPRMSYRSREDKINKLNEKKRDLIRANAPHWKIHEISMELSKL